MRKLQLLLILTVFFLSACQSYFGPASLNTTHPAYNQSIVSSLDQQMLLNLVRLKYRDQPYFLKVESVTVAPTFTGNFGINSEIDLGPAAGLIEPNVGISYADRPTITYSPLQGEDFLKSILSSISLEAILVMTQSGWSVDRVFGLCIERMNDLYNAPRASGPTPKESPVYQEFDRMLQLFREIQLSGDMEIGPDLDLNHKQNLVILFKSRRVDPKIIEELGSLLGFKRQKNNHTDRAVVISNNFLDLKPNQLRVRTRSISSILFYLSQNIEIPKKHADTGLVTMTKTGDGKDFDWDTTPAGKIFKVKSSDIEPEDAYLAVPYRGHWFYIDDYDLQSKSTFMLLMQLFDLQAGQTKATGPTLTLPVR
ncbi:MAG: hypothetical protein ACU84H_02185 [Gammaproteobacteria bacterium]